MDKMDMTVRQLLELADGNKMYRYTINNGKNQFRVFATPKRVCMIYPKNDRYNLMIIDQGNNLEPKYIHGDLGELTVSAVHLCCQDGSGWVDIVG